MHVVQYKTDGGSYDIRLNGVLVKAGDGYSGVLNLGQGLKSGENKIAITYEAKSGQDIAYFAVHDGCEGALPNERSLAATKIRGSGKGDLVFVKQSPEETIYPGAIATDGKGLIEAIEKLQAAAKNRDVETVFALHEPLLTKMADNGAPMERISAHVTRMLTKGEMTLAQDLILTPIFDGLAWEALTSSNQPPVVVHLKSDDGQYEWTSGTRWIFVESGWYVIEP